MDSLQELSSMLDRAASHLQGDLDGEQIQLYDLAFSQAEISAAQAFVDSIPAADTSTLAYRCAAYFAAEVSASTLARINARPSAYCFSAAEVPANGLLEYLSPEFITALGADLLASGLPDIELNEEQRIIRDTFHDFSNDIVRPQAEDIHRQDLSIPESILAPLREMGCFGLSVPERFGGLKPDNKEDSVGMVIVTEELSRGSLGAAGSLITRPEIMARAIMEGGTDEQKNRWLPGLAAGAPLCAISVTEPNTGSDVANVNLRATPTEDGWLLNGGKTWCTFAGKAELILVLARTDVTASPPHRGLSLFVVEKPASDQHEFIHTQPGGGQLTGRAIATMGYRGMHSYEMFYDDYFVPHQDLIGESKGEGKGFYFTMRGFMGGRLQTAARACGLMRAAFEASATYAQERTVFGQPVASYSLSLAKFARMGAYISACKFYTHEVAGLMDQGEGATEASLVKLLSCKAAEWVTREAQQLHGGMGYAEESAVSRYFADARVLSIFEGAEETLAIRVVGKALVDRATH